MLNISPFTGKNTTHDDCVFLTAADGNINHATCYMGFCPETEAMPNKEWFYLCVGTEKHRATTGFISVRSGGFFWSHLDRARHNNTHIIHNTLYKPFTHQSPRFGIFIGDNLRSAALHEELTRHVFGLCQHELEDLARAYYLAQQERCGDNKREMAVTHPDITSSKNELECDINQGRIPSRFPYLSFNQSGHFGSRVSLLGFYTLLRMQMLAGQHSDLYQRLASHLSDTTVLTCLMNMKLTDGVGLFSPTRLY